MPRAARRDIFACGKSDIAPAAQLYYIRSVNAAKITEKSTCDSKCFFLAGAQRLELWTRGFGDRCSTN